MRRAQVPMPALEAAIGVLLLTTVVLVIAVGPPAADGGRTQLDAYASDAGALLAGESPQHGAQTRLAEVAASQRAFDREREALARRVERILPPNLLYQIRTPHGTVGFQTPPDVAVGRATVQTVEGAVTVRVWYA